MSASSIAVGGRFQGTLLDAGDRHRLWVDLKAGEEITLGLFAASTGSADQQFMIELWRPDGENGRRQFVNTWTGDGALGSGVFGYRAVQSGLHELVVTLRGVGPASPADFAVQVYRSAQDEDPLPAPGRTLAQVGDTIQGVLGGLGDTDHVTLSLAAGQEVVLQLQAGGGVGNAGPLVAQALILDPALNTVQSVTFLSSGTRVVLDAETAGTYTVILRPTLRSDPRALASESSGQALGSYTLTVADPTAADEPDHLAEARSSEPLREGQSRRVITDGVGDRDVFRIDLRAGQVIELTTSLSPNLPGVTLQMLDAQGQPTGPSNRNLLRFEADRDGTYGVLVTAASTSPSAQAHDLRWTTVQPNDVGGRVETAATLPVGQTAQGVVNHDGDFDVYAIPVRAGQRLSVLLTREGSALPGTFDVGVTASVLPSPAAEARLLLTGDSTTLPRNFVVERDGVVHVQVQYFASRHSQQVEAAYRLQVVEQAVDDHAPSLAQATRLLPGHTTSARLEAADLDVFSLPLLAGERVQWTLVPDPLQRANTIPVQANVFEPGSGLAKMGTSAPGTLTFEFTARTSGVHALALFGNGTYTIETRMLAPVDLEGSRGPGVTLVPAPGFTSMGLDVQARPGAAVTLGTPRDDRMTGTSGQDTFMPGNGNDRVDGGPGLDAVRLPQSASGFQIQRIDLQQWQIIDRGSPSTGTKVLVEVERILDFAGWRQHLALDLDGHAGDVARLAGALLGKVAVADRALVGTGLYWLDEGVTGRELADAAVTLEQFLSTLPTQDSAGFVRQVHLNVTGQPPTTDALNLYVGWLEQGVFTRGELLWLASQTDAMALQIDLVGLGSTGLAYQGF